jgi:mRNA export factor
MESDLLDSLLELEEKFYKEGYDLGLSDGAEAGYTEGSVFAVEKGFEKLLELGRLYGRALVWAQRLVDSSIPPQNQMAQPEKSPETTIADNNSGTSEDSLIRPALCQGMPRLSEGSRLAKNIQTLLSLVDPATLSLENTEDAVSEIEDRLKAASLKAKLIQRVLGERDTGPGNIHLNSGRDAQIQGDGSGSIEDISSLRIRH